MLINDMLTEMMESGFPDGGLAEKPNARNNGNAAVTWEPPITGSVEPPGRWASADGQL